MNRTLVVLGTLVLAASGCASSEFNRHFDSGRYDEALDVFESDSGMAADDQALYRAALLHTLPDGPAYDPARAVTLLEHLLLSRSESSHRGEAALLLDLLNGIEDTRADATRRQVELEREVARLSEEAGRLEEELAWLHTRLERQEEDREALYQVIFRMTADLQQRYEEFAALQDELERLKAIDLRSLRGGSIRPEALSGPTSSPAPGATDSASVRPRILIDR